MFKDVKEGAGDVPPSPCFGGGVYGGCGDNLVQGIGRGKTWLGNGTQAMGKQVYLNRPNIEIHVSAAPTSSSSSSSVAAGINPFGLFIRMQLRRHLERVVSTTPALDQMVCFHYLVLRSKH